MHGIQLGRPVDLLVDLEAARAVGLDVLCGDDEHRFLPLSTATVRDEAIAIESALMLLDAAQLAFYRDRATSLRSLRGAAVEQRDRVVGVLRDVQVDADGALVGLDLENGDTIEYSPELLIRPISRELPAA
jgi:hypothetical protein